MVKIVNVKFPAMIGYRSGKEYAYLWDGSVTVGDSAIVKDTKGQFVLVKVSSIEKMKPMPYEMKWLVQIVDDTHYNQRGNTPDFE